MLSATKQLNNFSKKYNRGNNLQTAHEEKPHKFENFSWNAEKRKDERGTARAQLPGMTKWFRPALLLQELKKLDKVQNICMKATLGIKGPGSIK